MPEGGLAPRNKAPGRGGATLLAIALVLHVAALEGCVSYQPAPLEAVSFREYAKTQEKADVEVTAAALGRADAEKLFPVHLDRNGIQPVWLEVQNRGEDHYAFFQRSVDRDYFSASETAYKSHYSATKRFLSYGLISVLLWPLLIFAPIQFVSARIANDKMEEHIVEQGIGNFILAPGEHRSGFVFTHLDEGTKEVGVTFMSPDETKQFEFFLDVPGLSRDHDQVDFASLYEGREIPDFSEKELYGALESLPCCVTNEKGDRNGDPMNLVLVGSGAALLEALTRAGWDETEVITTGTSWKTVKSFLFSSEYRYSPVSNLWVYGRAQNVAFQKARDTIHERNHLRLWLAPFTFRSRPVWVGQVSRDIGVKFHWKTITTHAIDGDVDDARENVIGDLLYSNRMSGFTYVPGVGKTNPNDLPTNLTGDEYHTDGYRGVAVLEPKTVTVKYLDWSGGIPPADAP